MPMQGTSMAPWNTVQFTICLTSYSYSVDSFYIFIYRKQKFIHMQEVLIAALINTELWTFSFDSAFHLSH